MILAPSLPVFYFRDFLLHILHKTVKLFAHIKDFRVQDGVYDRLKRVDLSYTVGWNRGKTKGKALFHFSFRVKKRRERLFFIFHFRVKKTKGAPKDYARLCRGKGLRSVVMMPKSPPVIVWFHRVLMEGCWRVFRYCLVNFNRQFILSTCQKRRF